MSETVELRPPLTVVERTTASGKTFWSVEDAEGRSLTTWSAEIVSVLRGATDAIRCEIAVKELADGRRMRNIVSIPGIVERERRAVRAGVLTDRQVALLAAVVRPDGDVLDAARRYLAWLSGGDIPPSSPPPDDSAGSSSAAGRVGEARPAVGDPSSLEQALALAFPAKPALAERWLATRLRECVASSPDELTTEQRAELIRELLELSRSRA